MEKIDNQILENKIKSDFMSEFIEIINDEKFFNYRGFIIEKLSNEPIDYKEIFDFGFEQLISMKERPDKILSKFFFLLTSLKQIPKEACDFATEAMVYCESSEDYDLSVGLKKLKEIYNKVRPLLF